MLKLPYVIFGICIGMNTFIERIFELVYFLLHHLIVLFCFYSKLTLSPEYAITFEDNCSTFLNESPRSAITDLIKFHINCYLIFTQSDCDLTIAEQQDT